MRLFVLARHGESTLNSEQRINGDPARPVALTDKGRAESELLGRQLANVAIEVCIHTRFDRSRETAAIALAGRGVPFEVEPLLDDVNVGDLEGATIADYRAWKRAHRRSDPFPGGESLDDAARRYAAGFRRVLERPDRTVLVVCHEIPVRYALNGAAGSDELDGPAHKLANATPYLFDEEALERAVTGIERTVGAAIARRS